MPNILFTTYCNRSCPYCFALDVMDACTSREITMSELINIADMLVESGKLQTGILGGEPTLHPYFPEMINYLLLRGIHTTVFTNGLGPDRLLKDPRLHKERSWLKFVVNINHPADETALNSERQLTFLKSYAPQCDLSVNIYRLDRDPVFVADIAREADLHDGRVRVGLAQPIAGEANLYLSLEHYKAVAARVVQLADAVFDHGLTVSLDCGFPMCCFSDEQLGHLRRRGANLKFVCGTALDLGPGSRAWSCFPLVKETRVHVEWKTGLQDLRTCFNEMNKAFRANGRRGLFEACNSCAYYDRKTCAGGCVAHLVTCARRNAQEESRAEKQHAEV